MSRYSRQTEAAIAAVDAQHEAAAAAGLAAAQDRARAAERAEADRRRRRYEIDVAVTHTRTAVEDAGIGYTGAIIACRVHGLGSQEDVNQARTALERARDDLHELEVAAAHLRSGL